MLDREREGPAQGPTAAVVDSQPIKAPAPTIALASWMTLFNAPEGLALRKAEV